MQFINGNGDTLTLNNEPTIKFVCIDKDTFYYDNGFVLLKGNSEIKLAVKHGFKVADLKNKTAAYDITSSTSSVSSMSSFNDGMVSHQLTVKGQMQISETTQYYFGDKYGHFVLASKKNLIDLFPGYTQLRHFLNANNIDFSKRDDLEKLMNFLIK